MQFIEYIFFLGLYRWNVLVKNNVDFCLVKKVAIENCAYCAFSIARCICNSWNVFCWPIFYKDINVT